MIPIPKSMSKKVETFISDAWDFEENNFSKMKKEKDEDEDEEDEEKLFSESEYVNLFEQINELYKQQEIFIPSKKETNSQYFYEGLDILNDDLTEYFNNANEKDEKPTVHICAYHVNEMHKYPFLEFFLFKEKKENENLLHFPNFKYENSFNVLEKSFSIIKLIGLTYGKQLNYDFKGYLGYSKDLFLFFDCSNLKLNGFKMSKENDLWLATIDEIINQKKTCDINIEQNITELFINNEELLYLSDKNGLFYEIPTTAYSSCSKNKLDFVLTFGVSPSTNNEIMGNYYYFTNYQNAVKLSFLNDENENGGLIRCALFLGNMKVPMNINNDIIDESEITQNILLNSINNVKDKKNEQLLLRIIDRNGLWTHNYDSVYLGKIELDDGSFFEKFPLWVVKDYEQQVVLSAHILDKNE